MDRNETASAQIDLIATIEVRPHVLPAAVALLLKYGEVVRAEPGNLRFEAYRDRDSGSLVIVERYDSPAAFDAHLTHPANAEFNAKLTVVLSGGGSSLQMLDLLG
ncbi:MAG: putative quinol monooxygenase [Propionicimonas sp.]